MLFRSVFVDALANVARCGQYGAVAAFLAGGVNAPRLWPLFQDTVTALESDAAAAPLLISGVMDADKREWLEARGCLVFREPAHTMEAVAALARAAAMEATAQADDTAPALPTLPQPVPADANALSEAEAMALLADAGVPVVPHGVAQDAEAAVEIAGSIGYPVAVKICSRHILHKSDIGGVVLNLRDADAVRAAFEQVRQAASQAHDADGNAVPFEGAIVAGMARGWGEIMVGVRRDPVFGLVALAGIGGTAVEIFRQMAFGLAPLSRQRARAMLTQSRAAALCSGHRGHPAIDLDRVADVLVNVSRAAAAIGDRLDTLEINPFIVGPDGLVAADAMITLR